MIEIDDPLLILLSFLHGQNIFSLIRSRSISDVHNTPTLGYLCYLVSLLQLMNYVVRFVTVTLTGITEHQRQILHFPQHRGR